MRELRQVQKAIEAYEMLFSMDMEEAKKNCIEYMKDVYLLQEFIKCYLDITLEDFLEWCDISVDNFNFDDSSIIFKIKKKINNMIINHYLSKLSYELASAEMCKEKLKDIMMRFEQIKYLLGA